MGCLLSIFRFGTYVVKESDTNSGSTQAIGPEIRKHSSTPIVETTPKQQKSLKTLQSSPKGGKNIITKDREKEKTLYKTTFETQVDAAPPHPLEEHFQDIQFEEIEIDTNLFTPEAEDAVIKIQAGVRGYLARKQVKELRNSFTEEDDTDTPVVPPPKSFDDLNIKGEENQALSPLTDLTNWKKLSQHLEEKLLDDIQKAINSNESSDQTQQQSENEQKIHNKLSENIIPLKDSNDNKVIETYVCKDNILDVEPIDDKPLERTVSPLLEEKTDKVVEKVFNVLLSETESENYNNFEELIVKPSEEVINNEINNKFNELNVNSETPESEVLSQLNKILDNNDQNCNESQQQIDSNSDSNESKVVEIVSQNTTQEIIRNSFQEFVKEMTQNPSTNVEELLTESDVKPEVIELKAEERKTDSKIFEEQVIQTIFDEELSKNQNQNQIIAIEVFKHDIDDKQLENVVQIKEPEESLKNIEDRVYKTSVDEFVVKPVVESQKSVEELIPTPETPERMPVLETEQKIEIISTESRKNSEDFVDSPLNGDNESPDIDVLEVIPIPSPIIQIEEQNGRLLDEEEAAIRIQAAFRGFQIRRSLSREVSPNRSTNRNNNIDNNNNSHNNSDNNNNEELIESQTNNELLIDCNSSDHYLMTNELPNNLNNELISASNEQINTSLERLEDQLMQQLMAANEDEYRNESLNNDFLQTNELLDEIDLNSSALSSPLLLQQLQQSVTDIEPEVVEQEVIQTIPELVSIEKSNEEQMNDLFAFNEEEGKPLIQKSDTIIVDLLSSSPQKNRPFIDNIIDVNLINSSEIQTNDNIESEIPQNLINTENISQESDSIPKLESNEIQESIPEPQITESIETTNSESTEIPEPEPENPSLIESSLPEFTETQELQSEPEIKSIIEGLESESKPNDNNRPELTPIEISEPTIQTSVEPPTPSDETPLEITPEVSFVQSSEQPVLTKVCSSESEQESDIITNNTIIESPTLIPVLESDTKKTSEPVKPKRPKPILKDTESQIRTNLLPEEQTHSTSDDISSPDDDNPEFVGLGPNTPNPIRASSPNPFGKKRRRGKKTGPRK